MEPAVQNLLADVIKREKVPLLSEWETEARNIPGTEQLHTPVLRDHFPVLIDTLTKVLAETGAVSDTEASSPSAGVSQFDIGLNLAQVFEEYRLLRECIVHHIERLGLSMTREASDALNALVDNGMRTAINAYIARRNETERMQREEYLTFVVHDLRAPLTAIYNAVLLLEHDLKDLSINDRTRAIPGAVKRNIERMQALMLKLLQADEAAQTKKSTAAYAPLDLHVTTEAVIRSLAPSAATLGVQLINQVSTGTTLSANEVLIERVLQNLIHNAITNTPGGTVTVSASRLADGGIECRVGDTGRGIPDHIKAKLFERYASDRKQSGGIGLGLSIVKRLIESQGGSVAIDSQTGAGTTVRFSIPNGARSDTNFSAS